MGNLWQLLQETYPKSVDGCHLGHRFCLDVTHSLLVDLFGIRI